MANKPKRRCGTCRFYEAGPDPAKGACTNVAIAHEKDRVQVREEIASCGGLYFGKPDLWEARPRSWWPFGQSAQSR